MGRVWLVAVAYAAAAWTLSAASAFSNRYVRLEFDDAGRLASLRENASGRELVARAHPFAEIRIGSERIGATSLSAADGDLVFGFGTRGRCRISVTPFDGGWTFRVREADLPGVDELVFAQIPSPACAEKKGTLSNVVMDGESAVVIRGYSPEVEMERFMTLHGITNVLRSVYTAMAVRLA